MIFKQFFKRHLCGDIIDQNTCLHKENAMLKEELLAKASHFWIAHRWLGVGQIIRGVVMDGELVILDVQSTEERQNYNAEN